MKKYINKEKRGDAGDISTVCGFNSHPGFQAYIHRRVAI